MVKGLDVYTINIDTQNSNFELIFNPTKNYDLQSPVEADRTTCRDPAGPGPQTSPRGPGSRTAGLPGTNGVESPGDQARAWSQSREVLFQKGFLKAA